VLILAVLLSFSITEKTNDHLEAESVRLSQSATGKVEMEVSSSGANKSPFAGGLNLS